MTVQVVKDPGKIHELLLKFDDVLPHLKEKVSDYGTFSEKLAKYANVLCAVDSEEICGFVVFYANDEVTHTAFITLLACARGHQGRGLGRYLMEQACGQAFLSGMTKMRLEVDLDNTGAIAFYTKLGFVQAGEKMPCSMYMEKHLSLNRA